jgi:L-alanine-DL-glutamate epimerase-like enolase superfamily enzyme
MASMIHPHLPHIPSVGGIDIGLWDLAGKILDRPVYQLLGGPFREQSACIHMATRNTCSTAANGRPFYDKAKSLSEGFTVYKQGFGGLMPGPEEGAGWLVSFTPDE